MFLRVEICSRDSMHIFELKAANIGNVRVWFALLFDGSLFEYRISGFCFQTNEHLTPLGDVEKLHCLQGRKSRPSS